MPGPVLTTGSSVQCAHIGDGKAVNPVTQVKINGLPVIALSTTYNILPCQAPTMSGGNLPVCVSAQFSIAPSTKVFTKFGPVILGTSNGTSLPNGTPLVVVPEQIKVNAT
jgi:hypothetical protein